MAQLKRPQHLPYLRIKNEKEAERLKKEISEQKNLITALSQKVERTTAVQPSQPSNENIPTKTKRFRHWTEEWMRTGAAELQEEKMRRWRRWWRYKNDAPHRGHGVNLGALERAAAEEKRIVQATEKRWLEWLKDYPNLENDLMELFPDTKGPESKVARDLFKQWFAFPRKHTAESAKKSFQITMELLEHKAQNPDVWQEYEKIRPGLEWEDDLEKTRFDQIKVGSSIFRMHKPHIPSIDQWVPLASKLSNMRTKALKNSKEGK